MTLNVTLSQESLDQHTDRLPVNSSNRSNPSGASAAVFGPIFQQFENEAGPTSGALARSPAQTATEIGVQGSGQGNGSSYSGQDIFAKAIRDAESPSSPARSPAASF